jgi:hypothetical protein
MAIKTPARQKTEAIKTRRLKNPPSPRLRRAGCEVDFFFIDEVESLRRRVLKKAWLLVKPIRRRRESPIQVPQTQSVSHPHAQRNAFRRRGVRLQ